MDDTVKDLIKILPFDEAFKKDLLARYDRLIPDQRLRIDRIIWRIYDELFEARLAENIQLAFERAKKNEEKLDGTFYARIRKQTRQKMEKEYSEKEAKVDLSETREELAELLKQPKNTSQ